jgi:hypothetical protein
MIGSVAQAGDNSEALRKHTMLHPSLLAQFLPFLCPKKARRAQVVGLLVLALHVSWNDAFRFANMMLRHSCHHLAPSCMRSATS